MELVGRPYQVRKSGRLKTQGGTNRGVTVELDSIVDTTAAARELARSLDVPHYGTFADLLENRRPDGIIIATPNQLHVEHGLECINIGIPILIEKPLATSSDDGEQLVTKAKDSGVPVLVGHHRRHNPLIQRAKKEIESGEIGSVVAVNAQCWFYKPDEYYEVEWRTKPGAGPVFVNLIHDIDLLRYLCGEIESVIAITSNRTRHLEVPVDLRPNSPPALRRIRRWISGLMRPRFPVSISLQIPAA